MARETHSARCRRRTAALAERRRRPDRRRALRGRGGQGARDRPLVRRRRSRDQAGRRSFRQRRRLPEGSADPAAEGAGDRIGPPADARGVGQGLTRPGNARAHRRARQAPRALWAAAGLGAPPHRGQARAHLQGHLRPAAEARALAVRGHDVRRPPDPHLHRPQARLHEAGPRPACCRSAGPSSSAAGASTARSTTCASTPAPCPAPGWPPMPARTSGPTRSALRPPRARPARRPAHRRRGPRR